MVIWIIIKGLNINFLDNNLDYAGAHGKGKLILSRKKNTQIDDVVDWSQCIRKEETSLERVIFLLKNYQVPCFAVYRTDIFKKIFKLSNWATYIIIYQCI